VAQPSVKVILLEWHWQQWFCFYTVWCRHVETMVLASWLSCCLILSALKYAMLNITAKRRTSTN